MVFLDDLYALAYLVDVVSSESCFVYVSIPVFLDPLCAALTP